MSGQSVLYANKEYLNGQCVTVTAAFRSYNSYAESFHHANVIRFHCFLGIHTIIQAFGRVILAVIAINSRLAGSYAKLIQAIPKN